jgi:Ni,Fe-hydrogenase maturation factor
MPTSNLLRELRDLCQVDVVIIAGQVESIPEMVRPGLSDALARSVPVAAEEVLKLCDDSIRRVS